MNRILMIGTFLSKSAGSMGASEKLLASLESESVKILSASHLENRFFRIMHIIIMCFFSNYNIIHIDTFSGRAFTIAEIASMIGRIRRKKIVLSLHGGRLPEYYQKYPLRVKRTLEKAGVIKTPSIYLKEFFIKQNFEVKYLPNSILLSSFPYNRTSVNSHTILWVRAFSTIYNPHLAVLALKEVQKTFPDVKLTMIGPDKGLRLQIEKLISKLELDNSVTIIGPVNNKDLFSYYQTHEVFLNTTSYESFGVAVIEAAACGIPIVSTNVGEIPYLYTHGENMMTVDGFDHHVFANEIIKIFESPLLANRLSVNARKVAERFDWEIIKNGWQEILSA